MTITTEQKEAIRKVVDYSIEEERTHLEEHIATMWDIDATEINDKELHKLCQDKNILDHVWNDLYVLNCLLENRKP